MNKSSTYIPGTRCLQDDELEDMKNQITKFYLNFQIFSNQLIKDIDSDDRDSSIPALFLGISLKNMIENHMGLLIEPRTRR